MPAKIEMIGKKFNRWTVLDFYAKVKNKYKWTCKCECGVIKEVDGDQLRRGHSKSCGCLKIQRAIETHTKHGHSKVGIQTSEYSSWQHMRARCCNINFKQYHDYGGRGIKVCDRWLNSFENFLKDMGVKPHPSYTLERTENNGNYEPSNCKWATRKEQQRNRKCNHWIEYNGERLVLTDWAIRFGIDYSWLWQQIKNGKPFNDIVEYYANKNKVNEIHFVNHTFGFIG